MPGVDLHAAGRMALRDALLLALALAAWVAVAALDPALSPWLTIGVAIVAVVLTSLAIYLVHEWGHLIGAWLGGATVEVADRPTAVFLFRFDTGRSSRREFLAMSYGGFVASVLSVALLLVVLPFDGAAGVAGKVAIGLAVLGVFTTFALEGPTAWRVARGGPLPTGAAYVSSTGAR
jgi:hypothetical protein